MSLARQQIELEMKQLRDVMQKSLGCPEDVATRQRKRAIRLHSIDQKLKEMCTRKNDSKLEVWLAQSNIHKNSSVLFLSENHRKNPLFDSLTEKYKYEIVIIARKKWNEKDVGGDKHRGVGGDGKKCNMLRIV